MQNNRFDTLYPTLAKTVGLATIAIILLWLLSEVIFVLLVFVFAIVLALIINRPVSWLETKGFKRIWASLIVLGAITLAMGLLGWLVLPKFYRELVQFISNLPAYINGVITSVSAWVEDYPEIRQEIEASGTSVINLLPPAPQLIQKVSNYSMIVAGGLFMSILFACIVAYAVTRPRPLIQLYLSFFPPQKLVKAEQAMVKTSRMLAGWIKANLIGGSIEAVCTTAFLSAMNVPGAWIWGALTLFAELIPNIGFYLMTIPPVLVALSVSPMTALWVLVFFIVLSEIMSNFVMPRLLSSHMNIHPVSTLFMLMVMGSAFGLAGALLTVPVTAIIKAYYEEFYGYRFKNNKALAKSVENIVYLRQEKNRIDKDE